ncbi:MAG: multifunctional CCA addition/repair protein [Gammaproteobacteria bacterium]|nr:multifunctional CCA addition/repair protein [Gammaproteobacteria bacterium]
MKIYLVGGAVRDRLLGREAAERDWVVVGASPEALLEHGYKPVGKDFPVFLHPETGEEYALARTERKTAPGYHGFEFYTDTDVTLEDDLVRRDLTINAMAEDEAGNLIDPHGGQNDLAARRLRHVSPAFREDPVRILRVARFAARLAPLGFAVAGETQTLMREMVTAGEADHLVAERVWKELARALAEPRPDVFVRVLRDCGALARVLPEVDRLFGVPQPAKYHPEIDTGEHVLLALRAAAAKKAAPEAIFAVLMHDLGKAATPADELPRHIAHDARGVPLVRAACERLGAPRDWRELALVVTREHLKIHRALELRPKTLIELLTALDAWRRPERFAHVLAACAADTRGRKGNEDANYSPADYLERVRTAAAAVRVETEGREGPEIGRALYAARVAAAGEVRKQWNCRIPRGLAY